MWCLKVDSTRGYHLTGTIALMTTVSGQIKHWVVFQRIKFLLLQAMTKDYFRYRIYRSLLATFASNRSVIGRTFNTCYNAQAHENLRPGTLCSPTDLELWTSNNKKLTMLAFMLKSKSLGVGAEKVGDLLQWNQHTAEACKQLFKIQELWFVSLNEESEKIPKSIIVIIDDTRSNNKKRSGTVTLLLAD